MFKVRPLNLAIRHALRGVALVTLLSSAPAWATVDIPEALSSGQQLGADSENQSSSNIANMQNNVSTTTGATAGGTNSTLGVSNTQAIGNPANGEDAESGASASGSYNFTINCNTDNQQNPIFPGDYGLFAANCTYSGTGNQSAVSGMSLYSCPASINGGNCDEGSPNWQSAGIGPGQTVQIAQGVTVTLNNCPANNSGECSGTVNVSNTTTHTSANLNNDATDEVVAGGSGVDTMLGKTYNSGNYQTAIQTGNSAYQLNSCTQQIKGGLNGNGIVYTCNGQQNADFNATDCQSTEQCVRYATQTESYTESCNQDIPLTENACTTVTPTQNCIITDDTAQYACQDVLNVTVNSSDSCTPGQWYTLASGTTCGVGGCTGDIMFGEAGGECYGYTLQVLCQPGSTTLQYQASSSYSGQGQSGTATVYWNGSFTSGYNQLIDPNQASNNCSGGYDWYPDITASVNINSLGNVSGTITFDAWMNPGGYFPLVACNSPTLVSGSGPQCATGDCFRGNCQICTTHGRETSCTSEPECPRMFESPVFCNAYSGGPSNCTYIGNNEISYDNYTWTCNGGISNTATGDITTNYNANFVQEVKTANLSWDNGCAIYENAN